MFNMQIFVYWVLPQLIKVKSQCDEIQNQKQCNEDDQFEWDYWQPSKCQNLCSLLTNEKDCNFAANCKWVASSSSCFIKKCTEEKQMDRCNKIVAFTWVIDKCLDSTCICTWNDKRKLCYDKKCSDYYNQYDCSQFYFIQNQRFDKLFPHIINFFHRQNNNSQNINQIYFLYLIE